MKKGTKAILIVALVIGLAVAGYFAFFAGDDSTEWGRAKLAAAFTKGEATSDAAATTPTGSVTS